MGTHQRIEKQRVINSMRERKEKNQLKRKLSLHPVLFQKKQNRFLKLTKLKQKELEKRRVINLRKERKEKNQLKRKLSLHLVLFQKKQNRFLKLTRLKQK